MARQKHSDDVLFCVYVLWVKGHTETSIARWMGLNRKQVSGIINRSPYRGRAEWTDAVRRTYLWELKEICFDADRDRLRCGGRLRDFDWSIEPLEKNQRAGGKR